MADSNFEDRKLLIEAAMDSSRSFDKAILTLTSGAFGLSLIFLKDIARNQILSSLNLLKWGWFLFALSLVVTLVSFLTSQLACTFEIGRLYRTDLDKRKNRWGSATTGLNIISIISLVMAILFMGNFFFKNLSNSQREYMEKKPVKINEGYVPNPTPGKGYVPTPIPPKPQEPPKNPPPPPQPESPKPKK